MIVAMSTDSATPDPSTEPDFGPLGTLLAGIGILVVTLAIAFMIIGR